MEMCGVPRKRRQLSQKMHSRALASGTSRSLARVRGRLALRRCANAWYCHTRRHLPLDLEGLGVGLRTTDCVRPRALQTAFTGHLWGPGSTLAQKTARITGRISSAPSLISRRALAHSLDFRVQPVKLLHAPRHRPVC